MYKQSLIEQNKEIKSTVGRRRKINCIKSDEILEDCYDYLYKAFAEIVVKVSQYKTRKDALLTVSTRAIKGLTKHLLKYTTMNNYKSSDVKDYSISYLEAFHSLFQVTDLEKESFLDNFLEFCTLTYPKTKVQTLISSLIEENDDLFVSLTAKLKLLKTRGDISKEAFISRAKRSDVFYTLIRLSKNVMQRMVQESKFCDNPNIEYLLDTFNQVLSSE